ncbi:hypothetical protein SKAU_G00277690 [Synaphobranchus kaupii]|uniref:Glycosyltransferase family 92 protein n=1 Tax=Synaphobranchus kaupii TaxID=118154 RepID=A0A9Q1EWF4_SYNKA|nr:hypothetical protein SKAU_G00277690 [Synaphobranchus kaupii]
MRQPKLLYVIMVASISSWLLFCFYPYGVHEAVSWYGNRKRVFEMEVGSCAGNPSRETIVPVCGGKALLVSAFRDERFAPRTVRVIGIARRAGLPRLYCHICTGPSVFSVPAAVLIHSDHFGFPYGTVDFLCQLPKKAGRALEVSISARRLPDLSEAFLWIRDVNRNATAPFPRQFSVCVSTLFGKYSNVLQFVQSMEMYLLLGAGKVFVYKSDCGPLLQKVLDHYSSKGLLEVVPWEVWRHLNVSNSWTPSLGPGDLHYHGQIAALNDCLYRNMEASAYVALVDIDEVIVPRIHDTWGTMMAFLSHRHLGVESFSFENSVFRSNVFGDGGRFDIWPHVPGVNILRHVDREPLRPYAFNARKLLVNPRAVVWTSVHHTVRQRGASLAVPASVARLHHCRTLDDARVQGSQLVRDITLWKYSAPLIRNVNCTLTRVLGT